MIYPQPFAGITTLIYKLIAFAPASYLRSLVVRTVHRHRTGVGSIPAGGPYIVDKFFSTVPGKNFDSCIISTRSKTHLPLRSWKTPFI